MKGTVYNGKVRKKGIFFSSSFCFLISGDGFNGENWWGWHVRGLLPSPGALRGRALNLTAASWIGVFPFPRWVLQERKKEAALSIELITLNSSAWLGLAGPIQSGTAFELSVAKATVVIRFSGTTGDPVKFPDSNKWIWILHYWVFCLLLPNPLGVLALSMFFNIMGNSIMAHQNRPVTD